MNANERLDEGTSDGEAIKSRINCIESSAVDPDMRPYSLNIAQSLQIDSFDAVKIDPTAHDQSTRLQKKEYVKKLKDLVESIHSDRSEEIRQRCAAVQQTADRYSTRRDAVLTFLKYHSSYETNQSKWMAIIEETFLLKQPVTPFRSFRGAEIEKEYRFSRGVEAVINDAASVSVMLENIGCHSLRWVRIKRENFLSFEETKRCPGRKVPSCVERQVSRLYHSVSSLTASSQSDSSNDDEIDCKQNFAVTATVTAERKCSSQQGALVGPTPSEMTLSKQQSSCESKTNKVSSSSGGSGSDGGSNGSNGVQDFQAKVLSIQSADCHDRSTSDASPSDNSFEKSQNHQSHSTGNTSVRVDSSSSEDDSVPPPVAKRYKTDANSYEGIASKGMLVSVSTTSKKYVNSRSFHGHVKRHNNNVEDASKPSASPIDSEILENGPHLIIADTMTATSDFEDTYGLKIKGRYIINDDDILSMEDILMCPFVFRSDNAVVCGACSECVMPGMLRAKFSARNKLQCLELVYDAMGFIQQLERASGSSVPLSSIPGSLGIALSPNLQDAHVITLSDPPYAIINVNAMWTRITGYTQLDCAGLGYLELLEGDATVLEAKNRPGKPAHFLDCVAKGQPACSTNIHYDKNGRDFIEFVCSYPLTNALDEVTHILHVCRELPSFETFPLQAKN